MQVTKKQRSKRLIQVNLSLFGIHIFLLDLSYIWIVHDLEAITSEWVDLGYVSSQSVNQLIKDTHHIYGPNDSLVIKKVTARSLLQQHSL